MSEYRCIVADPPWAQTMRGKRKRAKEPNLPSELPYPTMSLGDICAMRVGAMAADDGHLWLWTTNEFLEAGFHVMRAWGFKYLAPITWVKPSGVGNWFVHRTQTLLMGYRHRCVFGGARYRPTVVATGNPKRHSEKPAAFYELIEAVSPGPRLELFARAKRPGWDVWGNEVSCDVTLPAADDVAWLEI